MVKRILTTLTTEKAWEQRALMHSMRGGPTVSPSLNYTHAIMLSEIVHYIRSERKAKICWSNLIWMKDVRHAVSYSVSNPVRISKIKEILVGNSLNLDLLGGSGGILLFLKSFFAASIPFRQDD